jgi:hypothetical protein
MARRTTTRMLDWPAVEDWARSSRVRAKALRIARAVSDPEKDLAYFLDDHHGDRLSQLAAKCCRATWRSNE